MYKTKRERWTMPDSYFGETWPDYYCSGFGQHRDSDALERSNFAVALRELGGGSETVIVVRESHWAVGWIEWIAIQADDETALRIADELNERRDSYPALDESDWSDLEWNEAADYWDSLSPREKVRMALYERSRCHWLNSKNCPVWMFGRYTYSDFPDNEIARALEETLRQG
jgi:hypothetical protein